MIESFVREERFIVAIRAGIGFARGIGRGESCYYAWFFEGTFDIKTGDFGVRVRSQHGPGVQQAGIVRDQVVCVEGFAGDVGAGAFVRRVGARFGLA
jgi:hypothetical protein